MSQSVFGSFKKTLGAVFFVLLVGMLLIGLSMFGVTDAFMSKNKDAAATVGNEKITLPEFNSFFDRRLSEYNKTAPERVSSKQAYERGLHGQVLNTLITEQLIQIDADNLGLAVNKRDALALVESYEVFNNEITGKFDVQKVMELRSYGNRDLTPKQIEKDVHKEIRRNQAFSSLEAGLVAPSVFADQQYKFMTEQRDVKLLVLTPDAVTKPADPSDEELQEFIKASVAGYTAPEYRRFTLLRMELFNVLPDIEVTEDEIKKHFDYKVRIGQLGTDETRSYQQLTAKDKEQADKITAALNSGKEVAAVMAEFTLDVPEVYTNAKPGTSVDPNTDEAAFKMDKNTAQTVASSFGGWYSVLVTGITPKITPDLESQRAALTKELRTNKAKQVLYNASKIVQDGITEKSMTLEEAGLAGSVSVASFDYMSRLGETQSGAKLKGIANILGVATDDKILKEIFLADLGFDGDVFETTAEGIAAVRVDEIKESAPRAFEDVREKALAAWHAKKADEALAKLSEDLLARANGGESLQDIADSIGKGADVVDTQMVRAAQTPGLGAQVIIRLFEARTGQIVRGTASNGLDRIIGQVVTITPNTDAMIPGITETLQGQAAQAINADIQSAYHAAVLAENPAQTMTLNIEKSLGIGQ